MKWLSCALTTIDDQGVSVDVGRAIGEQEEHGLRHLDRLGHPRRLRLPRFGRGPARDRGGQGGRRRPRSDGSRRAARRCFGSVRLPSVRTGARQDHPAHRRLLGGHIRGGLGHPTQASSDFRGNYHPLLKSRALTAFEDAVSFSIHNPKGNSATISPAVLLWESCSTRLCGS